MPKDPGWSTPAARNWLVYTSLPVIVILLASAPELSPLFACSCAALSSRPSVVRAYGVSLSPHTRIEQLSAPTAFTLGPVEKVGAYD
jgi:hypothetical protein